MQWLCIVAWCSFSLRVSGLCNRTVILPSSWCCCFFAWDCAGSGPLFWIYNTNHHTGLMVGRFVLPMLPVTIIVVLNVKYVT